MHSREGLFIDIYINSDSGCEAAIPGDTWKNYNGMETLLLHFRALIIQCSSEDHSDTEFSKFSILVRQYRLSLSDL